MHLYAMQFLYRDFKILHFKFLSNQKCKISSKKRALHPPNLNQKVNMNVFKCFSDRQKHLFIDPRKDNRSVLCDLQP